MLRGLKVTIFSRRIEAGAGVHGIEHIVTHDQCLGELSMKLFEQLAHGGLLSLRAGVGRAAFGVQAAFVADADGMAVVVLAVGTDNLQRATDFNRTVTANNIVVAAAILPAAIAVPAVDSPGDRFIAEMLQPLAERSLTIAMTCGEVLMSLSKTLLDLHEMPKEVIKRDQFIRLAERVVSEPEYGGPDAQKAASRYVVKLKNETPEEDWPRRREDDINASGDLISEMKYGGLVFRYLSHNYHIKGNYAGFVRFLNTIRKDITKTDLSNLLEELFRILYLRDDKEQQEAREKEQEAQATAVQAAPSKGAEAVRSRWAAVKPQKPGLPKFFDKRLINNSEAVEEYYKVLHHCGFFIGRALTAEEKRARDLRYYDGWKWKCLREAFIKLGFFKGDSPKKGFAEHLTEVFPYLVATNIQRGFNDRGGYTDDNTKDSIITAMIHEFEDVKTLMENT